MKYFLIAAFLLSYQPLKAADSTFNWAAWKKTWPKEPLTLKDAPFTKDNSSIQSVELIDMRSDTSCLGLDVDRYELPHCIVVDNGLNNWLNANLSANQSGCQLLFVVKSLWINEFNSFFFRDTNGKIHTEENRNQKMWTFAHLTKLTCKLDVFFKNQDTYQPLVRLDTALLMIKEAYSGKEDLAADLLAILRSKIAEAINSGRYKNRSNVSRSSIMDSYSKVFRIPILNDSFIRNGIFYSWEQFKQNRPDTITYSIQRLKSDQPSLFVRNTNGLEVIMQEGFALNDGSMLYRLKRGSVFRMFRDNNALYSMQVSDAKVRKQYIPLPIPLPGIAAGGVESLGTSVKYKMAPYLLDPETGEEY